MSQIKGFVIWCGVGMQFTFKNIYLMENTPFFHLWSSLHTMCYQASSQRTSLLLAPGPVYDWEGPLKLLLFYSFGPPAKKKVTQKSCIRIKRIICIFLNEKRKSTNAFVVTASHRFALFSM